VPQILGVVTNTAPKVVERRDGSGSFTLYEVWIDGQGPFVARKDVYTLAQGLIGVQVEAVTRTEQKGNFLNHYLDFIQAAQGQGYAAAQTAVYQAQAAQQQPVMPQPQTIMPQPMTPQAMTAEAVMSAADEHRELSIHRQTAAKVAAAVYAANAASGVPSSALDFWSNIEALVRFFQSGVKPTAAQPPRQNAAAYQPFSENQASQNQFVPAGYTDPGPDPNRPAQTDDDIPF
jgi:hypothetical protein